MDKETFSKLYHNTLHLIHIWFEDRKDKGGNDYVKHLYAVADAIEDELSELDFDESYEVIRDRYQKAIIVGLLHDILEDTECPESELRRIGCDDEIIEAIKSVTRRNDEHKYFDFIKRAKENSIGRIVKKYDLKNNMDVTRLKTFGDYEMKRLKKYWYSYKYITDEISKYELDKVKL